MYRPISITIIIMGLNSINVQLYTIHCWYGYTTQYNNIFTKENRYKIIKNLNEITCR